MKIERGTEYWHCEESLKENKPLLIFIHGAGESSMTWKQVTNHLSDFSLFWFDQRSHGQSILNCEESLTLDQLAHDVVNLVTPLPTQPVFIIGHSLGGAVATEIACLKLFKNLKGIVVLDVVGGFALEHISYMNTFLENMPDSFKTIDDALTWNLLSRNPSNIDHFKSCLESRLINKGDEFIWRTQLKKTSSLWLSWFTELSPKFLKAPVSKLLVLAGTERLDKELMIGHMQGKFQLSIIPHCGHYIQEEKPQELSDLIREFVDRNAVFVIKKFDIPEIPKS